MSVLEYPPEVIGNPRRQQEWAEAHTRGLLGIRATSKEEHQRLLRFKWWCEDNGKSTCPIITDLTSSLVAADDAIRPLKKNGSVIVNLQQQNTFIHQVDRPRRLADPGSTENSISNGGIADTTTRMAFQSLVVLKALQLQHSFCFRDFLELSPDHFKKVISRLKKKGSVATVEPRTCPRFYRLTPKLLLSLMPEDSIV